jgi:uncharacterized phage protein (TIGR02216 family)
VKQFDWPGLMRAGLNGLGLTPREFWALTPAELRAMLGLGAADAPMARSTLNALLRDFPDKPKEQLDG